MHIKAAAYNRMRAGCSTLGILVIAWSCSPSSPPTARTPQRTEAAGDTLVTEVEPLVTKDEPPVTPSPTVAIPRYEVVARVKPMAGGMHGDVLIPSVRPDMSVDSLTAIALSIVAKENLTQADFYRTESARRANLSASYGEQHPGALEKGYIGDVKDGAFTPSQYVHDPRYRK